MSYPVPLQVHIIWHPRSDERCRPHAQRIYSMLNRDVFQPLVPGMGIPVFFRSAGRDPVNKLSEPAPISVSPVEGNLTVFLLTSEFVLDDVWEGFRTACVENAKGRRDKSAVLSIFLEPRQAQGGAKGIVLDPASPRTSDLLVQHVLLQACRLLAGRARDALTTQGAAPLRLFLSHTKRDSIGLKIADALKKYLDATTVERFFDEVSIQPGDDITPELEEGIKDSALVAIRTDGYAASPWCRLELALAKRERRPMVVIDALTQVEARATPFMANLASVRIDPSQITDEQLDRVANFTGLEVLRFLYVERQLIMLQQAGIVPTGAMLLPRPPEARDLIMAAQSGKGAEGGPVFIYPDPLLSQEETEELAALGAAFKTPISIWSKRLAGLRLGLSVSPGDKAEEAALGLSPMHLEDATKVIARQALAAGATLVYGGALNVNTPETRNLTVALHEMIGAYNRASRKLYAVAVAPGR
jgi:SLOG cluster2/TIR domain